MAWQGLFILIVSTWFRDYYFNDIYYFRDELEGTVGYIFLAFMVLTSFHFGRKRVNPFQWKLIQKGGVYFLWAYPFSVYWWNVFYYPTLEPYTDPRALDYIFYWAGFIAFALRVIAWGKKRADKIAKNSIASPTPAGLKILGGLVFAIGLIGAAYGQYWPSAVAYLLTPEHVRWASGLELWLPFWPLEPFVPLLVMGLGTMVMTIPRRQTLSPA